jgi:hypothetical protein
MTEILESATVVSWGPRMPSQVISTQMPQSILDRFEKHAAEIGHLVFAWARLQQSLGRLFTALVGGSNPGIPLAIWVALASDRSQRDILEAVAKIALADCPEAKADVLWLLKAAGDRTTGRNDTVRNAFLFSTPDYRDILPVPDFVNNPGRLERFTSRELPDKQCEDLMALSRFAAALADQFLPGDRAHTQWPERPQL